MLKPYYQDEWVTIYHGDCSEILPQLPKVDLVLTDPPYNVGKDYGESVDDSMSTNEYKEWCNNWFLQLKPLTDCIVLTTGITNLPMWIADIERTHKIIAWVKENQCSRNYLGVTSGFNIWEPILVTDWVTV
jgi:DNA modification methylase